MQGNLLITIKVVHYGEETSTETEKEEPTGLPQN